MAITLYGIPNCDTVRKARRWLKDHGHDHDFHDYKKLGVTADMLTGWASVLGWEKLLNRAGTTFRKLDDAQKANLDQTAAIALMVEHTSLIKRPVVEYDGGLLLGFKEAEWQAAFPDS